MFIKAFTRMILLTLSLGVFPATAQQTAPADIRPLVLGQPVESELKGGEAHTYAIGLEAGQFLHLVVAQKGIDVVVTLFDPENKKLTESDGDNGAQGPEPVYAIVKKGGNYLLEVRSVDKTAITGRYEAKISEARAATDKDKNIVAARDAFNEGERLRSQGTAESFRNAIKEYEESLKFSRAAEDPGGEATTLNSIGFVYFSLGERQKAVEYFMQALPLSKAVGDKAGEARNLGNIGGIYFSLGERQKALEYFVQAGLLQRAAGDTTGEAMTLNNIGLIYDKLGERQRALDYFTQALPLWKTFGNKEGEAHVLANIGSLYFNLGELQKALDHFTQALALNIAINKKAGQANVLNNLGAVYDRLGQQQKALDHFLQALPIIRIVGDKVGEAATLNNVGLTYNKLNDQQRALEYYSQSLTLSRSIDNKAGEATTLNNIGSVYRSLGERQKAFEYYAQAVPLLRAVSDKSGEAETLDHLSRLMNRTGNRRFSAVFGKISIDRYQELRSKIAGLNKNSQQTYLKSIEGSFRSVTDVLIAEKRFGEAQQILNSFKDQQFFDFKKEAIQPQSISLTPRESEFTRRYVLLADKAGVADKKLSTARRKIGEKKPTDEEEKEIRGLEKALTAAQTEFLDFLRAAENEFAAPPDEKDKVPVIADLQTMQESLRETSLATKQNAVAVYTLVGEDNYRALVVTADDIFSVETPIKAADLNKKASDYWSLLRSPKYDPQPAANELYKIVFAPIEAKLPKGTKTILWSLDGNLRYIPMAALHDGKRYLAERYENVIFTRADKERMTRAVNPAQSGTGLGSSQAHSLDIAGEKFNAAALPAVKDELGRIFLGDDSLGVLSGGVLLDSKFTRASMLSELKMRRPLVHIASHFKFVPGDEARSFLLLGDGTPFTLDDMKQQTDLFSGVDLLTLSACDTAAQKPDANGREVDGFAELAQRLGAGAVMASLWEVADKSTAELMTRFYTNYRGSRPTSKADALRRAQLDLLTGKYNAAPSEADRNLAGEIPTFTEAEIQKLKLFRHSKKAPFAHPFYWSPFILIGNWK